MRSSHRAALGLVFESLACVWVLNAHLPGLISSPRPMPPWQQIALVLAIVAGVLPLAIGLAVRKPEFAMERLYGVLTGLVGIGLWIVLACVHPREIPPSMGPRLLVAAALMLPWFLVPVVCTGGGVRHRRKLFVCWLAVGVYAVCELSIGEVIRLREWRIMLVESDHYAVIVSDARRFRIAPHARWRHVYSSDRDGYFGSDVAVRYESNSQGLRERELPLAKPPGMFRIAALGDSFTLGEGVHVSDAWPQQLETILRKRHGSDQIEVINAGVNAYDTRQELEHYRRTVGNYGPDMVIIAMVWNDAHPGDARSFGASFAGGTAALAQYLPLADRVARSVAILFGYTGVATGAEAWRDSFAALAELHEELSASGTPLLTAIYPSVRHLGNPSLRRVYALQESFCRESGLPVFNAWPTFSSMPARRWYAHPADNHPNALAHTLFATRLADRIDAEVGNVVTSR